ncbi:MAG TPA: 4Fe-4S dicluster domain-containing protein [bacterium]|nr:4Fe-4S dicluster domain-containing protein [bacterium]HPN94405.1 4Fe-4S dicluster domain-containing protein [bacterium]
MGKALDLFEKEEFYKCLQCAICTGSCPVARVVERFNPREIILRYILYGEEDEVLGMKEIWNCATCHACQERCPHNITISGLLTHIQNLAAKKGNLPDTMKAAMTLMAETGWSIQATPRSDRVRTELGLAPLKRPDTAEIRKIFKEAGLDEILDLK